MNKCTENIEEIHQNPFFGTFLASAILDFYEMLLRMSAKGNRASTHRILKRMLDKRWLETEEGL
jgi:hypothetical protein